MYLQYFTEFCIPSKISISKVADYSCDDNWYIVAGAYSAKKIFDIYWVAFGKLANSFD
jgi:hypothetical protein